MTLATDDLFSPGAGFPIGESGFLAFGVGFWSERVVSARSDQLARFSPTERLPWEIATAATGAVVRGEPALYFVARTGTVVSLHRAHVNGAELDDAVPVHVEGTTLVPSWPQTVGLPDGRVLLAFVEPQRRIFVGVDDGTGLRFRVAELEVPESDLRGVLAHVALTTEGAWVLTYQVADASWRFRSFVLMSHDEGVSWSPPVAISPGEDISDAFPITRLDHGADIYYVHKHMVTRTDFVFLRKELETTVRRRVLSDDGKLGPEQRVTTSELEGVSKPQPHRLPDGRMAMVFLRGATPKQRNLSFALVDGDAPLPPRMDAATDEH